MEQLISIKWMTKLSYLKKKKRQTTNNSFTILKEFEGFTDLNLNVQQQQKKKTKQKSTTNVFSKIT